ncbi:hypothetical protein M4D79_13720 [Mycolicibacterium novocastrense]|nr:hypothetical protein M4D79_13720 [Mycolicibacterium novocastrense]
MSERRHVKPAQLDPRHLLAVWGRPEEDAYGELAVIATMALALRGLGAPQDAARAGAWLLAQPPFIDLRDRD